MTKETILEEYDSKLVLLRNFSQSMNSLVTILLASSSINPHSVSCRVKERSSLAKKIEKKEKYESLNEITDIVGLRIISNYSDEVDAIAKIIEDELNIDIDNSIDKRTGLDPDRFGYLSLHYVVSLNPDRVKLMEYQRFDGIKFEIQIRSILQHTWAEIEHDIGYKTKIEIPKPIRRKFSMLAGLLELADDQFIQVRNNLIDYEKDIQKNIGSVSNKIDIDAVTIHEYINSSQLVKRLDKEIHEITGLTLDAPSKENSVRFIIYLKYFNIESISELDSLLNTNADFILTRAKDIKDADSRHVGGGVSIFYLTQILAAKTADKHEILKFISATGLGLQSEQSKLADYFLDLGKRINERE